MSITIRIPGELYEKAMADLDRSHDFACERIGFFSCKHGPSGDGGAIVCLTDYHVLADDDYVDDPRVGARINSKAIRAAMQRGLDGKGGQIHVHLHAHRGLTGPSPTDSRELPALANALVAAAPTQVHGALILSLDSAWASVWLPGEVNAQAANRIRSVGFPIKFLFQ